MAGVRDDGLFPNPKQSPAARACCARRWGPRSPAFLEDPGIVEVMLNPDGRLWIDRLSGGLEDTGERLPPPTPSASSGSSPIMSASRFMPAAPASRPNCRRPASASKAWFRRSSRRRASPFASRPSPSSPSTTMSRPASCRRRRRSCCAHAVRERKNILVAGGTSTGKTTLVNALLAEVAKTGDRVVLIEDTRELQCAAPNLVALRTKDGAASLSDLVRSSLRLRPDRIPIGEVRGAEALDLLKAWGTGHPGGDRHDPRRLARSARCAASSSSSRKPSSPSRAR